MGAGALHHRYTLPLQQIIRLEIHFQFPKAMLSIPALPVLVPAKTDEHIHLRLLAVGYHRCVLEPCGHLNYFELLFIDAVHKSWCYEKLFGVFSCSPARPHQHTRLKISTGAPAVQEALSIYSKGVPGAGGDLHYLIIFKRRNDGWLPHGVG